MPTATSVPLLRWPVFAAVAALVVAWLGFAVLRSPDAPPEPPRLNRNIVASFWSVPVSGGRPRLLFKTRGWQDAFPTYRRDGSILFVRANATGQALFLATKSGVVRRLRSLPVLTDLVYSQATDEIVVWRNAVLYAESLSGKRRRLLATANSLGVWSPDGSAFAFARQTRQGTRPELVVIRARREQVFRLDAGVPAPVALSPNGEEVLFRWGLQLFLLDTQTGRRRLFANEASWVAWSPDGDAIAYADADGLVVRNMNTNRKALLVPGVRTGSASFSPDGRTLVYLTNKFT